MKTFRVTFVAVLSLSLVTALTSLAGAQAVAAPAAAPNLPSLVGQLVDSQPGGFWPSVMATTGGRVYVAGHVFNSTTPTLLIAAYDAATGAPLWRNETPMQSTAGVRALAVLVLTTPAGPRIALVGNCALTFIDRAQAVLKIYDASGSVLLTDYLPGETVAAMSAEGDRVYLTSMGEGPAYETRIRAYKVD